MTVGFQEYDYQCQYQYQGMGDENDATEPHQQLHPYHQTTATQTTATPPSCSMSGNEGGAATGGFRNHADVYEASTTSSVITDSSCNDPDLEQYMYASIPNTDVILESCDMNLEPLEVDMMAFLCDVFDNDDYEKQNNPSSATNFESNNPTTTRSSNSNQTHFSSSNCCKSSDDRDRKKTKALQETTYISAPLPCYGTNDAPIDDLDNLVVAQQGSLTNHCPKAREKGLSDLTKQINQLTLAEREKALYDLHGVSDHLPEADPQQVEKWLHQMDQLIPEQAKEHPGLEIALKKNAQYIHQERMKFLRADEYDPVKAAERMGYYFDMRLQYFCRLTAKHHNDECACIVRDLTIDDLTEDDLKYWRTGFYQVCREKDRAGRIVCIVFLPLCYQLQIPPESMVRVYLVMNSILTQNVEVQRSGNVHIAYAVGLGKDSLKFIGSTHFADSVVKAGRWAPLRGVAKHFCYDHESLHPMFQKYARPMATFNAVRFRSHFGTNAEVMYNLLTFGISAESLPITPDGVVKTDFHLGLIQSLLMQQQSRNVQEQQVQQQSNGCDSLQTGDNFPGHAQLGHKTTMSAIDGTVYSSSQSNTLGSPDRRSSRNCAEKGSVLVLNPSIDVILGRGTHSKNNPGNIRFKMLLEDYFDDYNAASSRMQKACLVNTIMKQMQEAGSRFLFEVDDSKADNSSISTGSTESSFRQWTQASAEKIRDKISHDFRNMRRSENKTKCRSGTAEGHKSNEHMKRTLDVTTVTSNPSTETQSSSLVPSTFVENENVGHITPCDMDILMGRHKKKTKLGTMLMQETLEKYYDEYEAANQNKGLAGNIEKTSIAQKVLAHLEAAGVRFLVTGSDGFWAEAPADKIHNKVTQDFRNMRWSRKKKSL